MHTRAHTHTHTHTHVRTHTHMRTHTQAAALLPVVVWGRGTCDA
jgi:hypothetical protein